MNRQSESELRLKRVTVYLEQLHLKNYRAIVFGSVGRGDFLRESDTDLLIISDDLPEDLNARFDLLARARSVAPEIEPVGWRGLDYRKREASGDPFLSILKKEGIIVIDTLN